MTSLISSFMGENRANATSPWGPVSAIFMTFGLFAFQIFSTVVFGLVFVVSLFGAAVFKNGLGEGQMALLVDPIIIAIALGYVSTFILLLFVAGRRGGKMSDVLLFRRPQNLISNVLLGIMIVGVFFVCLSWVIQTFFPQDNAANEQQMKELFGMILHTKFLWLGVGIVVIGAPVLEESIFRGFLLTSFAQTRIGFWWAVVATSAFWALIHFYAVSMMVGLFVFGILLSFLVRRAGSVWVGIIMHALWNGVVTAAVLVSLSGVGQI